MSDNERLITQPPKVGSVIYSPDYQARESEHMRQVAAFMDRPRETRDPTPCMYLFRMGDVYKIGYTTNPDNRIPALDTPKLPYKPELAHTIYGKRAKRIETDLHREFANVRLRGEWFALSPDDVEYIKSLDGTS